MCHQLCIDMWRNAKEEWKKGGHKLPLLKTNETTCNGQRYFKVYQAGGHVMWEGPACCLFQANYMALANVLDMARMLDEEG